MVGLDWPDEGVQDMVLAVSEATTNVVQHAYFQRAVGDVRVIAHLRRRGGQRYLAVIVSEWGRWRLALAGRGRHGGGLVLMRGCTRWLNVQDGPAGTTVILISWTAPRQAAADPPALVLGGTSDERAG